MAVLLFSPVMGVTPYSPSGIGLRTCQKEFIENKVVKRYGK